MYKEGNVKSKDINLIIFQKFFIQYLINEKNLDNYNDALIIFKEKYPEVKCLITENIFKKIKTNVLGTTNNKSLEEILESIKIKNNLITVDIHTINVEYINDKNQKKLRTQKIFIIGHSNMQKYLDSKNAIQFGIDCTYKIIPASYKPYKMI